MNCIAEIAKDAKVIEFDNQLLVLIKRQVETELMLEKKFRDLCEEVSNFVKEIEDMVKEVERLSCKEVAKETVRLLRRGQKQKMNCIAEIAKDAKVIEFDNQLLVLIKRQVETELMLEKKFRDLCEE
nr:hypothetical protein [Tanacetum cinerariifolium]